MALGNMNINSSDYIPPELQSVSTPSESEEVVVKSADDYVRRPLSALWSWIKSKIASSEVYPDVVTIQTGSLPVSTDWIDTGIRGSDLETDTYVVQFHSDVYPIVGIWGDDFSGIMNWYGSGTNDESVCNIDLYNAGHATNNGKFYLRTIRSMRSAGGNFRLQIKASATNTTAFTFTFKFRRLI